MLAIKQVSSRVLARARFMFSSGYLNDSGVLEALKEAQENPPTKFHNKKYYNPEYHYYTEGPDLLRVYSERDNSASKPDFTDVLDSVYTNVSYQSCRWSCQSIFIHYSTVQSSTPLNLSGLFTTLMKKALSPPSSEENMRSGVMQLARKDV